MHQIIACGFGIRLNVKIFAFLHAGQRGAHNIPGEISASAHGDDPRIQGFLHNLTDSRLIQIMKLDGLTGGKMHPFHLVFPDHFCDKTYFFSGNGSRRHTETKHTGFSILLGIASIKTGEALVIIFLQLAFVKGRCFFPESRKVLLPLLWIYRFHEVLPFL